MNAILRNQKDIEFAKHTKHIDVYKKDLTGNDENGRLSAHFLQVMPGGELVPHTHEVLEVFYIISGSGSALVNGKRQKAEAGSIIIAPPGSEHGLKNDGSEIIELYAVFSPGV
ncbi:MAG: cupin [Clostridia bacterium]|jgi:quercetin dioxygenase-like cupin family protein|nr:cupin [Clostridia bacterium]